MHKQRKSSRVHFVLYLFLLYFFYVWISADDKEESTTVVDSNRKVVLLAATKFFGNSMNEWISPCTSQKHFCSLTTNSSDPDVAAAIFHNADFKNQLTEPRLNVPYVLFSLESPANDHFRPGKNFINYTMTFRLDSDIPIPYGMFEKLENEVKIDFEQIWSEKSKNATWVGSNCHAQNGRSALIKEMQNAGLQVDVWGACGKPPPICNGVNNQRSDCMMELIRPYKFYISFENSNCKHYVTEKFYLSLLNRDAIPIVMKRKIYEEIGAPNGSYIAMDDFASVQEAVKFIHEVGSDKGKYLEYHKWRNHYRIIDAYSAKTGFCKLCDLLQRGELKPKSL